MVALTRTRITSFFSSLVGRSAPEPVREKSPAELLHSRIIDHWIMFDKEKKNAVYQTGQITDLKIRERPKGEDRTRTDDLMFDMLEEQRIPLWYWDAVHRGAEHISAMESRVRDMRTLLAELEGLDPVMHASTKQIINLDKYQNDYDEVRTKFRQARLDFMGRFPYIDSPERAGYHQDEPRVAASSTSVLEPVQQ